MRLRLVHSLSLALLSAVVVSVVAMGGFTAWNLRQGFAAYVQSRDVQRLETFVRVVTEALDAGGDAGVLTEGRTPMRSLVDEVLRREGLRGSGVARLRKGGAWGRDAYACEGKSMWRDRLSGATG